MEESSLFQNMIKEPSKQYDGSLKIHKISYDPLLVLGTGSMETKVFQGRFEGKRKVAVKRVSVEYWSNADREQALFLQADDHENVLRYYATEQCSRYCYLALELCEATLEQFIELDHPEHYANQSVDGLQILRQALHGIDYLHNLDKPIVHRDVKPSNVLIYIPKGDSSPRGKIADLGMSKQLKHHRQTVTMSTKSGTNGWMAPEVIKEIVKKNDKRKFTASLKVDVFCSGLLLYYVKSKGKHPFDARKKGDEEEDDDEEDDDDDDQLIRNYNIKKGKRNLKDLDQMLDGIYLNLIEKMISAKPANRPSMKACLNHPAFWEKKRVLEFLTQASDYLKEAKEAPPSVKAAIEQNDSVFASSDWISEMDPIIQKDLRENTHVKYKGQKVQHILQAIRDYSHHFNDKSPEVRGTLISLDKGLAEYFLDKFPALLLHAFRAMETCKSNDRLAPFYDETYSFA